jgi:hypothetical protein
VFGLRRGILGNYWVIEVIGVSGQLALEGNGINELL